jgi:acetyl esterase/lipase
MLSDAANQFHALLGALPLGDGTATLEESRAASEYWALATTEPAGVTYAGVEINGVPAEWALPFDADHSRVLLYLHGGGYSVGSIASHRRLVGHLASAAGVCGLSVGYRLAPEHPFPSRRRGAGLLLAARPRLRGRPHRHRR